MSALRTNVLKIFKELHRTRMKIFDGDIRALNAARNKINDEFKKNKSMAAVETIQEKIQYAKDVVEELNCSVVQAVETGPGVYSLKIRPETRKIDNKPFNINAEIPRKGKKYCVDCTCYPT